MSKIKTAINTVSTSRGKLGAIQNRLEHTINNLGVTTENITSAESRIRDVDMAKEMMNYTKNSVWFSLHRPCLHRRISSHSLYYSYYSNYSNRAV